MASTTVLTSGADLATRSFHLTPPHAQPPPYASSPAPGATHHSPTTAPLADDGVVDMIDVAEATTELTAPASAAAAATTLISTSISCSSTDLLHILDMESGSHPAIRVEQHRCQVLHRYFGVDNMLTNVALLLQLRDEHQWTLLHHAAFQCAEHRLGLHSLRASSAPASMQTPRPPTDALHAQALTQNNPASQTSLPCTSPWPRLPRSRG